MSEYHYMFRIPGKWSEWSHNAGRLSVSSWWSQCSCSQPHCCILVVAATFHGKFTGKFS